MLPLLRYLRSCADDILTGCSCSIGQQLSVQDSKQDSKPKPGHAYGRQSSTSVILNRLTRVLQQHAGSCMFASIRILQRGSVHSVGLARTLDLRFGFTSVLGAYSVLYSCVAHRISIHSVCSQQDASRETEVNSQCMCSSCRPGFCMLWCPC